MRDTQYVEGGTADRVGETIGPDGLTACMRALAAGDYSAFEYLHHHTVAQVEKAAFAITRDHHHAQDVAQEVFLEAWRNAALFDPTRASVLGWLSMIARRRAVDVIRHEQALRTREERHGLRGQGWMPTVADPVGEEILTRLDIEAVRRVLTALHFGQRQVLLLTFFAGATYREAAQTLGMAEGTAKTRIRAALQQLSKEAALSSGRTHQRAA